MDSSSPSISQTPKKSLPLFPVLPLFSSSPHEPDARACRHTYHCQGRARGRCPCHCRQHVRHSPGTATVHHGSRHRRPLGHKVPRGTFRCCSRRSSCQYRGTAPEAVGLPHAHRRHCWPHGSLAGPAWYENSVPAVRTDHRECRRACSPAFQSSPVEAVAHPSLPHHPNKERAPKGCGVLTVRPTGGAEAADRLVEATELWLPATSLGGVESSLERRRRFADEATTVPEDLLRLSTGIEDMEDLWEDLDRALTRSQA